MSDKPSNAEDEYFAREEVEKRYRLAKENQARLSAADREAQKKAHWMHCSKCGAELTTVQFRAVEIEKCFSCGVVVLDDGELEKLAGKEDEGAWMKSFFDVFRR